MTLAFPKHPRVKKRDYLNAVHDMPCTVTGYERSTEGGPDVEPAHLNFLNLGRGMKASDWHVLPLVHNQHKAHDADVPKFWREALSLDKYLLMDMVKSHAKWRYIRWVLDSGGDIEAAVREIARDD